MKTLFEIKRGLDLLDVSRRGISFAKLEIQALEWACDKIELEGLAMGEYKIRERITKLEEMQGKKEIMGFATKRARAAQINRLKWVIDEYEFDPFEPLY